MDCPQQLARTGCGTWADDCHSRGAHRRRRGPVDGPRPGLTCKTTLTLGIAVLPAITGLTVGNAPAASASSATRDTSTVVPWAPGSTFAPSSTAVTVESTSASIGTSQTRSSSTSRTTQPSTTRSSPSTTAMSATVTTTVTTTPTVTTTTIIAGDCGGAGSGNNGNGNFAAFAADDSGGNGSGNSGDCRSGK